MLKVQVFFWVCLIGLVFFWGWSVNLSNFLGLGVEAGASPMYPQKVRVPSLGCVYIRHSKITIQLYKFSFKFINYDVKDSTRM